MAALKLPSSVLGPVPHQQAYPFEAKRYGSGIGRGGWMDDLRAVVSNPNYAAEQRKKFEDTPPEKRMWAGGSQGYRQWLNSQKANGDQPPLAGYGVEEDDSGPPVYHSPAPPHVKYPSRRTEEDYDPPVYANTIKPWRGPVQPQPRLHPKYAGSSRYKLAVMPALAPEVSGGSSSFFRNRVRNGKYTPGASEAPATSQAPSWTQHDPNAVSGDQSQQGTGYMGPGGWVNTQQDTGSSSIDPANRTGAAQASAEKYNPNKPLSMSENQQTRQWGQTAMPDRGPPVTTHGISQAPEPAFPVKRKSRRATLKKRRGKKTKK